MFGALLGGATGALGLGGGVGASIPSGPSSSANSTSGDISPTLGGIMGGSVSMAPVTNIAFPGAELSSSADINPPALKGSNFLWVIVGIGALVLVLAIYKN